MPAALTVCERHGHDYVWGQDRIRCRRCQHERPRPTVRELIDESKAKVKPR